MDTPTAYLGETAEQAEIPDTTDQAVEAGPAGMLDAVTTTDVEVAPTPIATDVPADEPDDEAEAEAEDDDEAEDDEARVVDSDLLLRLSLLTDTLFDEMRRSEDLSGRAVGRARSTVKTVVDKIPDAVSSRLAEEAALLFAELPEDADEAEVRIALSHVVGWFNGIFQSMRMMSPEQIRAALQAGMGPQAGPPPGAPGIDPSGAASPGYI